jgi:RNA polymerase sigma-70 factor (ECF subfamily)
VEPLRASAEEMEMVARAQRGDSEVWDKIYDKHHSHVYQVVLRMVKTTSLAEDLTQEVFKRAWTYITGFRYDCSLASWLHGIAVNIALTHLQKPKHPTFDISPILEQFSDNGDEAKSIEFMQNIPRLEKAIRSLPDAQRIAFVLCDIHNWLDTDVANLLHVTPGTVRTNLCVARETLRKEVAK